MLQIRIQTMASPWTELTPSRLQRHDIFATDANGIAEHQSTNNVTADVCRSKPNNMTHKYYITVDLKGRLGNQMFEYATLQGLARRTHHTPLTECKTLAKHFPFIAANCMPSKNELLAQIADNVTSCTVKLRGKHSCIYETSLVESVQKARNKNIHITRGFLQSWKYFRNVNHIIRQHFQFHPNVLSFATKYLQLLIDQFEQSAKVTGDVTAIGVHVRRGDFMSERSIKRGRSVATADYFHAAMNYFRKQYTNCVFLIASDDVKWCREHLMAQDVIMIADNKVNVTSGVNVSDVQRDMSILRLVEHNIISTGSFSWWIGWFTRGQVVYYKDFPANGSSLSRDLNKDDYYPQQWIAM